jgi:hypothetical protein
VKLGEHVKTTTTTNEKEKYWMLAAEREKRLRNECWDGL